MPRRFVAICFVPHIVQTNSRFLTDLGSFTRYLLIALAQNFIYFLYHPLALSFAVQHGAQVPLVNEFVCPFFDFPYKPAL